ncbi:MAG: heme o synthase [Nitrospinota bacterium]
MRQKSHVTELQAIKTITGLLVLPKPGIVALVLVSCMTGLYIGGRGMPDSEVVFWVMLGLGTATAGATTLNNFVDRDIDGIMHRTRMRSIPSGSVSARRAFLIGTVFVTVSLIILKITVGNLVTLLTGLAVFIYVILYTIFFKRLTPFATHIGGVAGAMPPLIGYAASTGSLDVNAFILFMIIVVWQQPHFWVLALKYREDYAKAGIPILPVARGVRATKVKMFWYTLALFPITAIPYFIGIVGVNYLAAAVVMNFAYLSLTIRFLLSPKDKNMFLFFFSIAYLGVIFCAMIIDL